MCSPLYFENVVQSAIIENKIDRLVNHPPHGNVESG